MENKETTGYSYVLSVPVGNLNQIDILSKSDMRADLKFGEIMLRRGIPLLDAFQNISYIHKRYHKKEFENDAEL
jgi:hypothetical protein